MIWGIKGKAIPITYLKEYGEIQERTSEEEEVNWNLGLNIYQRDLRVSAFLFIGDVCKEE